jgi:hypothetical protein
MSNDYNYPNKKPDACPPVVVNVYGRDNPPALATFNKGGRSIKEIEQATNARRNNQTPGNYGRKE